jgi:hypothetical protein
MIPNAIVGDLDSISEESLATFREIPIVPNTDTEHTDSEKAVEWILAQGSFEEIILLGASAGRLDHVLGHLSLLHRYRGRVRIVLEDDHMRAWLASTGEEPIDAPVGTTISFFAVGAPAEGVTTVNLRYPLVNRGSSWARRTRSRTSWTPRRPRFESEAASWSWSSCVRRPRPSPEDRRRQRPPGRASRRPSFPPPHPRSRAAPTHPSFRPAP